MTHDCYSECRVAYSESRVPEPARFAHSGPSTGHDATTQDATTGLQFGLQFHDAATHDATTVTIHDCRKPRPRLQLKPSRFTTTTAEKA